MSDEMLFWLKVSGWVLALLVLIGLMAYYWPSDKDGGDDERKRWR